MSQRILVAALCTLMVAAGADATRVQRLSLTELRDRAAAVLLVEVLDSTTRIGHADMVWTDYRVRAIEVLHGSTIRGEVVVMSFAGGRAEGREVGIAGVPTLRAGARYVIFLDAAAGRPVPAVGWGQGIFEFTNDARGETLMSLAGERLERDLDGHLRSTRSADSGHTGSRARRLPDPVAFDGDGNAAPGAQVMAGRSSRSMRPATLGDLRAFVAARANEAQRR